MPQTVTSKSLRTAAELTLIADIKPGFVQTTDLMSFVTRLGFLLRTLFELRKRSVEQRPSGYVGPLEKLRSLHFVRWSILEGRKLLLAVEFDRAWEPYIRGIVDDAGPFLDVIFCHCVGYDGHATIDGYAKFAEWVRAHQVDVPFFYAGSPDLTVDDQRYLKELVRRLDEPRPPKTDLEAKLVQLSLGEPGTDGIPPVPPPEDDPIVRLRRAVRALLLVRPYFPDGRDEDFFDRAAFQLLEALIPRKAGQTVQAAIGALEDEELRSALTTMDAKTVQPVPLEAEEEGGLASDLQGNVLTEYVDMTHGCLALVRFDTKAAGRALLAQLAKVVTTDAQSLDATSAVNVSLTMNGLVSLGLSETELAHFPKEFREGMEARAGLLGDLAGEHPANWTLPDGPAGPVPLSTVDLVLSLQERRTTFTEADHVFSGAHPLAKRLNELTAQPGVEVLHVEALLRKPKGKDPFVREHFGFFDGVSQPHARTRAHAKLPPEDAVALGEIVLGFRDDRGETYPGSDAGLLCHGSYLVVRKISQDVAAFHEFVNDHAAVVKPELLYAKLMGRERDGAPLVPAGTLGLNDFDYANDARGDACPLFSHARRTNPRAPDRVGAHGRPVRTPRILRRGFSYGPVDPAVVAPRGLMFMAYNASIADQYEMIQRWLNGANSTGELGSHADPVASHTAKQLLTVNVAGKPQRLEKKKPFVKLEWGMYLFTPSVSALRALGARTDAEDRTFAALDEQALVAEGHDIIQQLEALRLLSGETAAKTAWKLVLEDRGARDKARAVWSAIRKRGGALRTPYGVLVGSAEGVADVLADGERCSVREYFHRMEESVGALYLGMDRCPVAHEGPRTERDDHYENAVVEGTYDDLAHLPNRYMAGLTRRDAFVQARQDALVVLTMLVKDSPIVDLRRYAAGTASAVSKRWFGLPSDNVQFREIFLIAAQNIFYPHPEPVVTAAAGAVPPRMQGAEDAALGAGPEMLDALEGFDDARKKRALVGGAQGFLVATVTSFASVANQWFDSGRVHRHRQWLHGQGRALSVPGDDEFPDALIADDSLLVEDLLRTLARQPQPDLLHRRAVRPKSLSGGAVLAKPGDTVVVGLGSAVAERPDAVDLLFGGTYYPDKSDRVSQHACPGKEAAVGVMLGLAVALLIQKELRAEGLLSVSFKT